MASIANSFALLHGAEQAVASANKKKKSKPKAPAVPQAAAGAAALGVAPAAPQAPPSADLIVASVERDAREHKTVSDKARLWREWIRQASDKSATAPKYQTPSGDLIDFKQVLTSSKALEISIEGCLLCGVPTERDASLAALLSAVLPAGRGAASGGALGSALGRLCGLVSDDAPDTLGAAQRAVHTLVAAIKVQPEDHVGADASQSDARGQTGLQKVVALDQQATKQQAVLVKLGQASLGVVSKEQTSLARQIYRLHEEKLDLLAASDGKLGAAAPASSSGLHDAAAQASVRSLDELKAVIANHIKALESAPRGKMSADSAKQNLAAYRREEGLLEQQAAEVSCQIRALESQLHSLRNQAAEIEDKKAQIQQRQRMALDAQQQGGRGGQGQLGASHYQEELAVAEALQEIVDPSRSKAAAGQQQASAGAPASEAIEAASSDYITNAQRYLSLTLSSLMDMPAKVAFCRQRLNQALKLVALGAPAGAGQKEDAEKLLAETLRGAEEVMTAGVQVVGDVQRRYPSIMRLAPPGQQAAVSLQLQAVEGMVGQLRAAYDGVVAASTAPAAPEQPPARGGGGGGGRGGRGGRGGAHAGPPLAEAAPAAPPAAVPAVVAHPAAALPAQFSYLGLDEEAPPPPHIANGGAPPAPIAAASTQAPPPPAALPLAPADAAAAAPSRPVGPPPRTWGKVAAVAAEPPVEEGERGLTPAEAFRNAAPAADVAEGSAKPASARRNRRKA